MSQGRGEPIETLTNFSDCILFFAQVAAENGIFQEIWSAHKSETMYAEIKKFG